MYTAMSAIFTLRAHSVVAAILLAGAALVVPSAGAQSLADVAKKEEDRRKTVPEPAKVYTNKDLSPVPAGSPPPPAAAKTGDAAAKDADGDATAKTDKPDAGKEKKDEAYWAGRLKRLQDTLARDQNYADALQTRVNILNTDFLARDDPAQRAVIGRDRLKAVAELDHLTKAVEDGKKALADFMEEARRAGVPPGWLR
jgi:hypothetical protein